MSSQKLSNRKEAFDAFLRSNPSRDEAIRHGRELGYAEATINKKIAEASVGSSGRTGGSSSKQLDDNDLAHFIGEEVVDDAPPRPRIARRELSAQQRLLNSLSKQQGVLTREEEGKLAEIIQAGVKAQNGTDSDSGANQQIIQLGEEATWVLVSRNEGLAHKNANRFKGLQSAMMEHDDLVSECRLALHHAAQKFDPASHGTKFSTYATNWMKEYIGRIAPQGKHPLHSRSAAKDAERIKRLIQTEEARLGEVPSNEHLAQQTGLSVQRIEELRNSLTSVLSIDAKFARADGDDAGSSLADSVADKHGTDPEQSALSKIETEEFQSRMDLLPAKEREALKEYAEGWQSSPSSAKRTNAARARSKIIHPAMDSL